MPRKKQPRYPNQAVVDGYVDAVLNGDKAACPELIQAC